MRDNILTFVLCEQFAEIEYMWRYFSWLFLILLLLAHLEEKHALLQAFWYQSVCVYICPFYILGTVHQIGVVISGIDREAKDEEVDNWRRGWVSRERVKQFLTLAHRWYSKIVFKSSSLNENRLYCLWELSLIKNWLKLSKKNFRSSKIDWIYIWQLTLIENRLKLSLKCTHIGSCCTRQV